jgi:hypothetical protein
MARCLLPYRGLALMFVSVVTTTTPSTSAMASATSLSGALEHQTVRSPVRQAEGRENALDVAGLRLMSKELLRLLVWGGFVVRIGYRLSATTE